MDQADRKEREHFFSAAKLIAALTLLSRLLGMLRDMAIASLGATRQVDAFLTAFAIPNLFRRLFGEGALAGAFVPVFTETAKTDGPEKAGKLLANAMGLLAIFLTGLVVLIQVGLLIWATHFPGNPAKPQEQADFRLLLMLTSIMLPFMVSICLLALTSSALNCRGHFTYPAFAPVLLNVCVIIAAWFIAPAWHSDAGQLQVIAWSVTAASVVQLAGVLWVLHCHQLPVIPTLRPIQPGIRTMLHLMGPTLLAMGFPQLSELFQRLVIWVFSATPERTTIQLLGWQLSCPLQVGAQTRVYAASQLNQFPLGVLAISLGVAIFPLLSRYAARGELAQMRQGVNRALRVALMEGLAAGAGLFVLAGPITALIYQRRRFTPEAAAATAGVLKMYVLGMWAYCTYQIFLRAFYALKEPTKPLKVVAVMAVVNMGLVLGLIWVPGLGEKAMGLATSVTMSLDVLVLAVLLRRRLGRIGGRRLLASVLRSLAAAVAMAAALELLLWRFGHWPNWLLVAVGLPAGAGVFVLTALALRAPELRELLGKAEE